MVIFIYLFYLFSIMGSASSSGDYYNTEEHPPDHNAEWMRSLSDNLTVAALSIPGTHDTCAQYGGPAVKCQTWRLPDQLLAGIRFLDIRCRHVTNVFAIHHGPFFQNKYFGDVLNEVFAFLKSHPKEVVIMRVKEEWKGEDVTRSFEDTMRIKYLEKYGRHRFWLNESMPTVEQVRGKIVILKNFASSSNMGIPWGKQMTMTIADDYIVLTILPPDINKKWNSVRGNLDAAQKGLKSHMFITFSSGTSAGAYPNAVASRINPKLYEYIPSSTKRLGIIVMDFPGWDLIQDIIETNFSTGHKDFLMVLYPLLAAAGLGLCLCLCYCFRGKFSCFQKN